MSVTAFEEYDNCGDGFEVRIVDDRVEIDCVYDSGYCAAGCDFDLALLEKAIEEYKERKKESERND